MSARNNCGGDGANDSGGRWSEFLLPAVGGVGGEGEQAVEEGIYDKSYCSTSTFQSHTPFKSLPSYMKSKSGVEMDPDRYRRRKQMILELPEAASAKRRLELAATNWDPDRGGQLLGFDAVSLDPTQFKELFRRNFGVLLNAKELGVLVSLYDKSGQGRADSSEFLKDFWQLGREGRASLARKRAELVRQLHARQSRRTRERAERMSRLKEVPLGQHTENDVRSALAKLTEVAARYDTRRDNGFHHLERGGAMGPTAFRQQLRIIFGLRLTRAELGGLVSEFNLHRDGMVDAKEFAYRFHCLGRERRAAKLAEGAVRDERARRRKREQEEALAARMIENSKCKIKWEFTDAELARGKATIAKAACFYDRGRLAADIDRIAQMRMDPTSFRAQLLQNFRVRLGPGELGAIFMDFDRDNSKQIDGTELMNAFFRMGREERAKRLAQTERQRQRIESRKKGFRRKLEERFMEQTTAKVVWPSLLHDPFDEDFDLENEGSAARRSTSANGSMTKVSTGSASARRARPGDEGRGARPATRGGLRLSPSTAEFLGRIRKEELTIRAMTTYERRRPRDAQETDGDLCAPPSKRTSGHPLGGGPDDLKDGSRATRRHSRGRQEEGPVGKSFPGGSTEGVREPDGYLPPQRNIGATSRDGVINRELGPPADGASAVDSGATASRRREKEAARDVDDAVTSVASGSRDQARYDPTSIETAGSDGPADRRGSTAAPPGDEPEADD